MPIDSVGPTGNLLLDALSDPDRALLAPDLERVTYAKGQIILEAGAEVTHVTFPCNYTVLALVVTTRDGRTAETATIGHDGMAGRLVGLGHLPAFASVMVQIGGPMLRLDARRLEAAADQSAALRDLFIRYADCLVAQLLQTAACNALHAIEQRCLRWLLTLQDRIVGDTLPVTHEVLAAMLGVQRTYLTRILRELQDQGLIRVGRGRIIILDRPAVLATACECHGRVRRYCEAVLGPVYGAGD
ncbi:cAMP-binding domain of CRP or a regulatory subunit of cAMP-dependent protein kinases [Methylobacterium phyllostachyos]|uniref:cAMP-binding domain of CRP or a regulatory subunit of cAMP-dependent protein kinases n=1 Tax=Methylobacterium phyllostachyos TaxID=582672 RepID=A0A1G9R3N8_9HYPH|nr:Crp/Fnr family transcriptional regulator [Methylobacterium phyllostachyos]SDM17838.1 cAMP-binding domain of CRP or a regulatory subunit of cAMP-dependent protein kinases [Methylobacterium phyllostachyos]